MIGNKWLPLALSFAVVWPLRTRGATRLLAIGSDFEIALAGADADLCILIDHTLPDSIF